MVQLHGRLELVVVEAKGLFSRHVINPYCIVELVGPKSVTEIAKTSSIEDHCNPKWLTNICIDIDQDLTEIRFIVKDKSLFRDDKLGSCSLDASCIGPDQQMVTLALFNKKTPDAGQLVVKVKLNSTGSTSPRRMSKAEKQKGCIAKKIDENLNDTATFLHGKLDVTVKEAEQLPNFDSSLLNRKNKSDPFVVVAVQNSNGEIYKLARTETIDDNLCPKWDQSFSVDVCHEVAKVIFIVYDEDIVKHDKMCSVEVHVNEIEDGTLISDQRPLYKNKTKEAGKLTFTLRYTKISDEPLFSVPKCVFPGRIENNVKLYQDARCEKLPCTILDSLGRPYSPNNAWNDIRDTLAGAKKFICIAGWSLNASIVLVRTECGNGETIGKILLERADEGVDVRLLLWDEGDSQDSKKDTAKEFFKESLVKVDCVARKKSKKDTLYKDAAYSKFGFSHSQRCLIADQVVEKSPGLRNVVAYVGCFDLAQGRHDNPEHKLGHNGECESKSQFYNNLIATITRSSSKSPWHEVMCKVVGSAALDILTNFQDRWETEAVVSDSDFQLCRSSGIFSSYTYDSLDSWNVQMFRSASEDSVPLASSDNIYTYAGIRVDNSLYKAYLHQIRRSKRFIYMETSCFIGSSHFWEDCSDIQSKNLIPIEITLKITQKIKENKPYRVYIVLSLHPEGNPDDMMNQEILHWQYHTMEMMYKRISNAIQEQGLDAHPQDYLLFLSLGKREESNATPKLLKQLSEDTSLPSPHIVKNKRSYITVNSKLAVFDDEYIIIGSGNINDRSMVGFRNTELAIGAHQPRIGASGQVSIFRKCLWAEHLGEKAPLDLDPSQPLCMQRVHQLAEDCLKSFLDMSVPPTSCHMLLYPVAVERSGSIVSRLDCEKFPDTKASVLGTRSKIIPDSLTT
ncbi:phospholipase D gamma 1-like [Hyalella azteca]|uniref:phospholipase D n=1 Tax=Hyalella azteca TaxID=294128 RepID=A0A8B7P3K5_HYAAZ|nr:phospholipase D gamma 1-like [Hyalella azteca]